ncbi:MAG: DUF4876 domain-containing protein [Bacteroidota bacterium]|nr:DUF4876 domain-containing protein [Bacteroidota bacterium]
MKKILFVLAASLLALLGGCSEKPPVTPDGESRIILKALWNKSLDSIPDYTPMQNAKVILTSEYGSMVRYTDNAGVLDLSGIPSATYNISVRAPRPNMDNAILVGTKLSISLFSGKTLVDTIFAKSVTNTGISLNEIYAAGPVNNQFYFYDQFIELYNSSNETKYLDGMQIMRVSGNSISEGHKGPGADEDNDGDIDGITYIYKFPGNPGEKNHPFPPKKFIVIAAKALDHRKYVQSSIDLTNADWEFYNQYSVNDIDNKNVPNLINLRTDNTTEFLMGLVGDIIVIANGKDTNWQDGIDISTIVDAVEFNLSAVSLKTLDPRVDRGFLLSPSRYSGKSMQRREAGEDTDDAGLDWEILSHPTPGYQK